jgi:hypothetical protein
MGFILFDRQLHFNYYFVLVQNVHKDVLVAFVQSVFGSDQLEIVWLFIA